MSEQLAAAAAAMGLPEALVERSAAARAAETGASAEDVLAEWAGGEPAPVAESAPPPETHDEPGAEPAAETSPSEPDRAEATPEVVVESPSLPEPAPEPAPAGPYKPPVLVGASDNPMTVLAGVVGLFLIVVMVGLLGPSMVTDNPGARSSEINFSDAAIDGRQVYATAGCVSCHTQMVRPVIADVGLGAVTLNDSDQILGTRRFGPDLADIGSRLSESQIEATIGGLGQHPSHRLGTEDLADLVAYLAESTTSTGGGS